MNTELQKEKLHNYKKREKTTNLQEVARQSTQKTWSTAITETHCLGLITQT